MAVCGLRRVGETSREEAPGGEGRAGQAFLLTGAPPCGRVLTTGLCTLVIAYLGNSPVLSSFVYLVMSLSHCEPGPQYIASLSSPYVPQGTCEVFRKCLLRKSASKIAVSLSV